MRCGRAVELFSFGTLTYFLIDMKSADKKDMVSQHFDLNYRTVEDRMLCLSDLRNVCAHYTRLYENPFQMRRKARMGLALSLTIRLNPIWRWQGHSIPINTSGE